MSIALNRLNITGPLTIDTPRVVIREVAESAGIPFRDDLDVTELNAMINHLTQFTWPVVFQPFNDEALRKIARYVNPRVTWSAQVLLVAFHHLVTYSRQEVYQNIPPTFEGGPQTPRYPTSFNACILYRYCKEYGISVHAHTSLEDMIYAARLLVKSREELRSEIFRQLEILPSKGTLVNILLQIPRSAELRTGSTSGPTESSPGPSTGNRDSPGNLPKNPTNPANPPSNSNNPTNQGPNRSFTGTKSSPSRYQRLYNTIVVDRTLPTYENLNTVAQFISNNLQRGLFTISPTISATEAIVYGAILYQRDISENSDLAEAWRTLLEKYPPITVYRSLLNFTAVPSSSEKENRGIKIYDLKRRFNSKLPRSCYTESLLNELAAREGYSTTEIAESDPYYLLQVAVLSLTFYPGPPTKAKNEYTIIGAEKISDLSRSKLVSYGILDEPQTVYTYEELEQTFNHYQSFRDPGSVTNEEFSPLSINKLARLASLSYPSLVTCITNIKRIIRCRFAEYQSFLDRYRGSSEAMEIIKSLHEIAMYMRGWTGTEPFPIRNVKRGSVEHEERTEEALYRFFQKMEESEIVRELLKLPLLRYRGETYVASIDPTEGITIGDRLKLVMKGNTTENMSSCIRMSSNWLAYSAFYLMELFGMETPYNINELENIS